MICKLRAKAVASLNVPIRKLPSLTLELKELYAKVHNDLLSPSRRPTLGTYLEKFECSGNLCLPILLNNTILRRNRISSQIYEQPLGLLR